MEEVASSLLEEGLSWQSFTTRTKSLGGHMLGVFKEEQKV
jgi:hypothetical protein